MQKNQSNGFQSTWNINQNTHVYQQKRTIQNETRYIPVHTINPIVLIKKLVLGLKKLFVAIKFHFFRLTFGVFDKVQIPWFKVGLIALALFIMLKKDLRFQFNMKAPVGGETEMAESRQDEFGMVQAVNWFGSSDKATFVSLNELDQRKVTAYIRRFSSVAQTEMEKYKVPASIKMAQGIIESQANFHPHTRKTNNHFGRPLAHQKYNSAWENWRAHSLLIVKTKYKELLKNGSDIQAWAIGLQELGYSSDPNYAKKLLQIVEDYELTHLD